MMDAATTPTTASAATEPTTHQVSRLRRKLNERSGTELIRTIRNEGYMLLPAVRRL